MCSDCGSLICPVNKVSWQLFLLARLKISVLLVVCVKLEEDEFGSISNIKIRVSHVV